jgi:hypothetical protein
VSLLIVLQTLVVVELPTLEASVAVEVVAEQLHIILPLIEALIPKVVFLEKLGLNLLCFPQVRLAVSQTPQPHQSFYHLKHGSKRGSD